MMACTREWFPPMEIQVPRVLGDARDNNEHLSIFNGQPKYLGQRMYNCATAQQQ